jgi:hypothetical protein
MIAAPRHPDFQPTVGKLKRQRKGSHRRSETEARRCGQGPQWRHRFHPESNHYPRRSSRAVWEEPIPRHDRARMRHDGCGGRPQFVEPITIYSAPPGLRAAWALG